MRVSGRTFVVESIKNPLERIKRKVRVGIESVEEEIDKLRKTAEKVLKEEASERWP